MIVVTRAFSGILDAWLANHGKARPDGVAFAAAGTNVRSAALTVERWTQEVHAAVALLPGPARGLEIGAQIQLQHAGPLGYMVVNTQTFGELLDTYLLLEKWFYGRNWAQLSRIATTDGVQVCLAWDQQFGVPDQVLEQLHTMALLTLVRSACPTLARPLRVDLMNAPNGEARACRAAFECPVRFSQKALRIVFAAEALHLPVDLKRAALSPAWRSRQRTLREILSNTSPNAMQFVRAVQQAIVHTLPIGAPADAVATRLNLSRRTLQRRLTDAGCSYRQLLEGLRERHACHLLDDPSLSIKEIAFLLGYAEQSAFNHACLRWNQMSPRQLRHSFGANYQDE
jgi:AraC-like DNA-binding protein